MIGAWREVPGTAPPQKNRPVGYDSCRCANRSKTTLSVGKRLRVRVHVRGLGGFKAIVAPRI
jgi:hypothetical protein